MTKHLLWSASCAWLALMLIVWALFIPKGLSVDTFSLFSLAGALSLLAAARAGAGAAPAARGRVHHREAGR